VTWFAIVLAAVVALALIVARRPFAEMQAMVLGGRVAPGCVIAEAAVLLVIALAIFLVRARL